MLLQLFHGLVNLYRASCFVGSEVAVAQHGYYRCLIEELYCRGAKLGYVYEHLLVRMPVYQCVGDVESAFL